MPMDARHPSITNLEQIALTEGVNLSDGHPRMKLSSSQRHIIDRLAELFAESNRRPVGEIEREAVFEYFTFLKQTSALREGVEIRCCYSSSTAIDIVAKSLAQARLRVGMMHPTFDNIPDLVQGHGCPLSPVDEDNLVESVRAQAGRIQALFLVTPNNPTGRVITASDFQAVCEICRKAGVILVVDSCFRGQVEAAQYDAYAIAQRSNVNWVVIEDTGKMWPLHELKCGFLAWKTGCPLDLEKNYSDLMLSASPVVLALVRDFAIDASNGGIAELRALIARNRALVRSALSDCDFSVARESEISVDFARLPEGLKLASIYERSRALGVHLLPGAPFFWADPSRGANLIRVSLARDPEVIQAGIGRIQALLKARASGKVSQPVPVAGER